MPDQSRAIVEALEPRQLFSSGLPRFDHIVIVMEENKNYNDILGHGSVPPSLWSVVPPMQLTDAPYIRKLARQGTVLTNMDAETNPSQPNYLALFSGSTQGVDGDSVPSGQFSTASLGGQLIAHGFTFAGYSEDQPSAGYLGVKSGEYARKHNPWSDFTDVPASSSLPFSAFPNDYTKLPTLSFVVPNQLHDMHSASVRAGDQWLKSHLGSYASWARSHASLLIITWDEGRGGTNHIPTLMFGAHLRRGRFALPADHYRLLRTIEQMYALTPLGEANNRAPLRRLFKAPVTAATASSPALQPAARAASLFSGTPISAWEKLQNKPGDIS